MTLIAEAKAFQSIQGFQTWNFEAAVAFGEWLKSKPETQSVCKHCGENYAGLLSRSCQKNPDGGYHEPASTLKELDPELYEKAANHVVELHEPASTGEPPRVARNWDEQCKVELVVDKVTWYCQWKVHDGDNHFFGNPAAARPSESSQASAEPIPLQPRCPNCSGLLNFTHNRTITMPEGFVAELRKRLRG